MSSDESSTSPGAIERTAHEFSGSTSVSTTVVTAVARASGLDPLDLPPLYEHIDPDALDALISSATDSSASPGVTVTFPFAGYEVSVGSRGEVVVTDPA